MRTISKMKTNKLIFFLGEVSLNKCFLTALLYFCGEEQHQHVGLCVTNDVYETSQNVTHCLTT